MRLDASSPGFHTYSAAYLLYDPKQVTYLSLSFGFLA